MLDTTSKQMALSVTTAAVLCDWLIIFFYPKIYWPRYLLALGAVGFLIKGLNFNYDRFGLRLTPIHSWNHWMKIGAWIGLGVLAFTWISVAVLSHFNSAPSMFWQFADTKEFVTNWLVPACFVIPPLEELLYRIVLCGSLAVCFGEHIAILLGGIIFAATHFVYGYPSPDNFIAGFFFCWVFFRSGTAIVPLLFHCLGNLIAGLFHLGLSV